MDLFLFVSHGDLDGCKQCLDAGANPNFQVTNHDNWTPLHMAIFNDYYDFAELLLIHGADPNLKTGLYNIPLHNAIYKNDKRSIQLLLNNRSNIYLKNMMNKSPYDLALETGDPSIIELFEEIPIKEPDHN
jgi:ankyrin repeat protein